MEKKSGEERSMRLRLLILVVDPKKPMPRRPVEIILGIYESARTHKEVTLS